MAGNKDKEKSLFRELYLNTPLSQKDIAERLGISVQTANAWVAKDNLDDLRLAKNTTNSETIAKLRQMLKRVVDLNNEKLEAGELTPGDMDLQTKLVSQIENLQGSIGVQTIIAVLDDFIRFVPLAEKDFRKQLAEWQTKFLLSKVTI
jgi:transcriptional regulator with XRE-family HTH domain